MVEGRIAGLGTRGWMRVLAGEYSAAGRRWASGADTAEGMTERRWRVSTGPGRGLFLIEVDDGQGFRSATAAEVDAALRQRELFGAADYPARNLGRDDGPPGGRPNHPTPLPAGLDGRGDE